MRSTDYISKGTAVARLYKAREYLWFEIQEWFRPERYNITHLYGEADVNRPIDITYIPLEDYGKYYWYPVHRMYNLSRLGILEMEIDNQLREEGYGEG